mgnify:CR=1 FL=1
MPLLDRTRNSHVTGVNVKAQRRPIFDKAEDLDKQTKYRQIKGYALRLPTYLFARNQTSVVQGQNANDTQYNKTIQMICNAMKQCT